MTCFAEIRPAQTDAETARTLKELRVQILTCAARAREGHVPSGLSILDLLWVLYDSVLAFRPGEPRWEGRDRFVLSKGHGSLGLYAVLAAKGFFSADLLETFAQGNSALGGHPDSNKVPGVEASTGSLGHGFPMAAGMALGLKIKGSASRVFALVGDGECNEGTIWEAALLAGHHRLDNLFCIVDYNHSGDRALDLGDIGSKFRAFGWSCRETDGHDHAEIFKALRQAGGRRPVAVIAHTTKGKGCAEMEGNPAWHHRSPSGEELAKFLEALA